MSLWQSPALSWLLTGDWSNEAVTSNTRGGNDGGSWCQDGSQWWQSHDDNMNTVSSSLEGNWICHLSLCNQQNEDYGAGNSVLVSGVVECCHIWKSGGEPGCGVWGGEHGKYWAIIRLSSSGHVKNSSSHKFNVYLEHSSLLSSFCWQFFLVCAVWSRSPSIWLSRAPHPRLIITHNSVVDSFYLSHPRPARLPKCFTLAYSKQNVSQKTVDTAIDALQARSDR